jgi:signal peptidase II
MTRKTLAPAAFYAIAVLVAVADQIAKAVVLRTLPLGEAGTVPLWPGTFHLTHVHNRGAAFSLLEGRLGLILAAGILISAGIVATERRANGKLPVLIGTALALPLGGAIGNLIDRVRFGYVVDFLDFRLIHFPVFNLADSAITIGIALLILCSLIPEKSTPGTKPGRPSETAPENP